MISIKTLALYTLLVSGATLILGKVTAQTVAKGIKNVVLVHGAFADGSSWSKVVKLLQMKGYHVIAVQNPLTSLNDDVAATKRAIDQMDGPVLLVGHSYAGMVISEAGKDPKVAGLVYVAALVPEEGQNSNDVNAAMPTTGVEKEFRQSADGFLYLSEKAINESFAQDASPDQKSVINATQVAWAAAGTQDKVYSPAWTTKPSWFIIAKRDGMINPDLQRYKSKVIKATSVELDSDHVPMVTDHKKVGAFIIQAAQGLAL